MVVAASACHQAVAPRPEQSHPASPAASAPPATGEPLCCCEVNGDAFESRAGACTAGTPAVPDGTCVGWTACGFATGTTRTTADRPDLAPAVAVPAGACCCDAVDGFAVVARASCGECLDADWCAQAPPAPPPPAHTAAIAGVDRCVQIADHFEPWRKNPDWATEVSPRAQLISDCRAQGWSPQLQDCLLAAAGPLDLDGCVGY